MNAIAEPVVPAGDVSEAGGRERAHEVQLVTVLRLLGAALRSTKGSTWCVITPPSTPHTSLAVDSHSPPEEPDEPNLLRVQEPSRPEAGLRGGTDVVPAIAGERGERGVVRQQAAGDRHADADQALAPEAVGATGAAGEASWRSSTRRAWHQGQTRP